MQRESGKVGLSKGVKAMTDREARIRNSKYQELWLAKGNNRKIRKLMQRRAYYRKCGYTQMLRVIEKELSELRKGE